MLTQKRRTRLCLIVEGACLEQGPCSFSHDLGFSFFSLKSARRDTPETFTTLKRTPGISPTAWPFRPKPAIRTSSCAGQRGIA